MARQHHNHSMASRDSINMVSKANSNTVSKASSNTTRRRGSHRVVMRLLQLINSSNMAKLHPPDRPINLRSQRPRIPAVTAI